MTETKTIAALRAETEEDIATLSAIAAVKLVVIRQYQRHLLALRKARSPHASFARQRLLFESRDERSERLEALNTIAHQERYLANLHCDEHLPF